MSDENTNYIDTPRGIFSAAGIWFRTRESQLREYAGEVLEHEGIDELLSQAATWLWSGRAVVLWVFLAALMTVHVLLAVGVALIVFLAWEVTGPRLVNRPMLRAFDILERPGVQMAGYLLGLSILANAEAYWSVGAGLIAFIVVRWELLSRVTDPLTDRMRSSLYEVPVPDHVLRLVIVRAAMKYDVPQPDVERMRADIFEMMRRIDRS